MKTNSRLQRVSARFGRETRFKLKPKLPNGPADQTGHQFEQLKRRLLEPVLDETTDPQVVHQLRLAANEAAAAAWTTPFPLLFFPVLIEEKAAEVHQHAYRQELVQQASHKLAEIEL